MFGFGPSLAPSKFPVWGLTLAPEKKWVDLPASTSSFGAYQMETPKYNVHRSVCWPGAVTPVTSTNTKLLLYLLVHCFRITPTNHLMAVLVACIIIVHSNDVDRTDRSVYTTIVVSGYSVLQQPQGGMQQRPAMTMMKTMM